MVKFGELVTSMLFVGFALVITVAIAMAINADIGAMFGLSQEDTARAIPAAIILMLLASAFVGRKHKLGEIVSAFVFWLCLGAIFIVGYTYRADLMRMGDRIVAEMNPQKIAIDQQTGNVVIARSMGGSFRVPVYIDGIEVNAIFDTGATMVVLSNADARKIGIDVDELRYTTPVMTANGTGYSARVRLDNIRVGNIERRGIVAFVSQPDVLETSLLGMSFLETLSRYSVSNDTLELHH